VGGPVGGKPAPPPPPKSGTGMFACVVGPQAANSVCCVFKADVNLHDSLGRHSLHLAAEANSAAAVEFIVHDVGVSANLPTLLTHNTSLHFAAKVSSDIVADIVFTYCFIHLIFSAIFFYTKWISCAVVGKDK